jgi:hypothetical protein
MAKGMQNHSRVRKRYHTCSPVRTPKMRVKMTAAGTLGV